MDKSWVEIDLSCLRENILGLRKSLGKRPEVMFVVKADAYGHGVLPVARCAQRAGVRWFAVIGLDRARQLRAAMPDPELLLLGVAGAEDVPVLLNHRIIPLVVDLDHARSLAAAARSHGRALPVQLKVDTGMGRLGVAWQDSEAIRAIAGTDGLKLTGICSHFATVEPPEAEGAREQVSRFEKAAAIAEESAGKNLFKHISSSRAALYFREWDLDAIRPGIMLYGYGARDSKMRAQTEPILQWKTTVAQVKTLPAGHPIGYYGTYTTERPTDIGVLNVGYADGYLRILSNRARVLIGGRRVPVVGRVSMNWITVDLGPESGVRRGDEAVLIGRQGTESIWADELARMCRTIPYEILTNIKQWIERRYREE